MANSDEVEILACRKAIEFAMEAGFTDLVIKGENTTVMKAITDYGSHVSRLGHIALVIQMLMQGLQWRSLISINDACGRENWKK